MFYSHTLISRKGPLGNIWIAAFCFKKLKKDQIESTDISSSVDRIMPEVEISYRMLAQLLVGIVKIFSKKVDYLYHDCNMALNMIRRSLMLIQSRLQSETNTACTSSVLRPKRVTRAPTRQHTAQREAETEVASLEPADIVHSSHDEVTVTIPERFELDSFDLQISDEGEIAKGNVEVVHEDEWNSGRNEDNMKEASFNDKQYEKLGEAFSEFDSACFTPIDDVVPSYIMDRYLDDCQMHLPVNPGARREIFGRNVEDVNKSRDQEVSLSDRLASPRIDEEAVEGHLPGRKERLVTPEINEKAGEGHHPPTSLQENVPAEPENMQVEEPVDQMKPGDTMLSVIVTEKFPESGTHDNNPGHVSPKFMVATPARKDQLSKSRKRKKFFDATIVLSNEMLRSGIRDASDLVCKRRKAPHTFLDAWRAHKLANLQQTFMDPLIPYFSSELKDIFYKKSLSPSLLKKTVERVEEQVSMIEAIRGASNESPKEMTCDSNPLHASAPEDCIGTTLHVSETPDPSRTSAPEVCIESMLQEPGTPEPSQATRATDPSTNRISDTESDLHLMERDLLSDRRNTERGTIDRGNEWSIRTRAFARILYKRYRNLQEKEGKRVFSLGSLIKGQPRAQCTRFFYETLMLKTRGYIDVDQQSPYGDIMILVKSNLEAMIEE